MTQTVMSQYEHHHNYSANTNGPKGEINVNHTAPLEKGKLFHPVVDGFGNPIEQSRQLYDPAIVRSHQGKGKTLFSKCMRICVFEYGR